MSKNNKESLTLRFGLALGGITLLTFSSMLSSIFITESITGMGSAINQAGSLRMESFRIATDLVNRVVALERKPEESNPSETNHVENFESRLHSPRLKQAIPDDPESPIYQAYQEVHHRWEKRFKPILLAYEKMGATPEHLSSQQLSSHWTSISRNTRELIGQRYITHVDHFVATIDNLVKKIELENEQQIRNLHMIETGSLFIALLIVLSTMLFLNNHILIPLQSLLLATEKIRSGDFSYRASVYGNNELSELSNTFNAMSEELSVTYINFEQEIQQKTHDLRNKRNAMELLYNTSTILSKNPTHPDSYKNILEQIKRFLNIDSGLICLSNSNADSGYVLATTLQQHSCATGCHDCIAQPHDEKDSRYNIPIQDSNRSYGLLTLQPDSELDSWQTSALKVVSEQIASAINIARGSAQERESLINEERSSIARELHDSLAQSLTYLKIEVSRIQTLLSGTSDCSPIEEIVADVRQELNNAYRQLRELLTTFRLNIETDEFSNTILQAVEDFRQRGDINIMLDNRLGECRINPHEAVHLIYILREALNNIYQHASASKAWIELRCAPTGIITLSVQDNGVGLQPQTSTPGHYGLSIIHERSNALSGVCRIYPRNGGGTTIEVSFTPMDQHNLEQGNINSWITQI